MAGQTVQPRQNSPYEIRPDNTRSRSRVLCSEGRERARDRENACSPLFLLPKLKWPWPPRDARDFSQRFEPLSSRHDEKRAEGAGAVLGALPAPSRRAMRLAWRLARGGGSGLVMMVTYIMQKETCAAASDLACVGQRVTVSSRECGRTTTTHELMSMQPSFSIDAVGRSQKEGLSVLPCCCVRCAFWHVKSGNMVQGIPRARPGATPRFWFLFSGTEWTAIGLSRAWGLRLFPGAKKAAPFYYLAHCCCALSTV